MEECAERLEGKRGRSREKDRMVDYHADVGQEESGLRVKVEGEEETARRWKRSFAVCSRVPDQKVEDLPPHRDLVLPS